MTLTERLHQAQADAVTLYLRRQQLEAQRQQVQQQAQAVDLALVKSDGAIELLQALIAEETKVPSGV